MENYTIEIGFYGDSQKRQFKRQCANLSGAKRAASLIVRNTVYGAAWWMAVYAEGGRVMAWKYDQRQKWYD